MNLEKQWPINLASAGKQFLTHQPPLVDTPSMISVAALIEHLGKSIFETRVLSSRLEDRVSGILGPRKEEPCVAEPCVEPQHLNERLLSMISDLNKINNSISINVLRMEECIGF